MWRVRNNALHSVLNHDQGKISVQPDKVLYYSHRLRSKIRETLHAVALCINLSLCCIVFYSLVYSSVLFSIVTVFYFSLYNEQCKTRVLIGLEESVIRV